MQITAQSREDMSIVLQSTKTSFTEQGTKVVKSSKCHLNTAVHRMYVCTVVLIG